MTTKITTLKAGLQAGDSYVLLAAPVEYPSNLYRLILAFRGPGPALDLNSEVDGTGYKIVINSSTTNLLASGTWFAQLVAEHIEDGEQFTLSRQEFNVTQSLLSVSDNFDGRSSVKRALDAISAVLEKRASVDQEEYKIQDRSLKRTPIADLIKLQQHYTKLYNKELKAKGIGKSSKILVRFNR